MTYLPELLISLEMGLIYGIVAIGIYLTFRMIDFPDLTCDGSFVLGATTSSMLIKFGVSPWISLFAGGLSGCSSGFLTGWLNTKLKITPLLSGILVAFMLYSINLKIMGGMPNLALIEYATIFTSPAISSLVLLILIATLIWGCFSYLFITHYGLAIRSIGQNPKLATCMGVSVSSVTMMTLMLSNSLISLGGALFSQHQNFVDISQGTGTIIIGLAAVMIGEKLLPTRNIYISILACLFGSMIYRLLITVALHSETIGLKTQDLNLITGLLVILIMIIPNTKIFYQKANLK